MHFSGFGMTILPKYLHHRSYLSPHQDMQYGMLISMQSPCYCLSFFASNRTIYASYMPYLFLQMNRLPKEALESFNHGNFVAKLTLGTFNSVWMDYVLEATENKALKSSGGIIGLTYQNNALTRWFLSRPVKQSIQ